MPETPMNKNNCPIFRENEIRLARQRLIMQFIPETLCEQEFSDKSFRPGVPAPDPRHIEASGLPVMNVCHFKPINTSASQPSREPEC